MAGRVNIGHFRDRVRLNYYGGETRTAQGSTVPTVLPYDVWADVREVNLEVAMSMGLNIQDTNLMITCRPVLRERILSVEYNGTTYTVIRPLTDKHNQFTKILVRA